MHLIGKKFINYHHCILAKHGNHLEHKIETLNLERSRPFLPNAIL